MFPPACPRENTALRWKPGNKRFDASEARFQLFARRHFRRGRATRNMDSAAGPRDGNNVTVDLSKFYSRMRSRRSGRQR